ncbi:MAG TPA: hypothetical protein VNI84_00915 [Pyrinomonadaceae bacterium]|nr:hypothetical protein [Pyrinomonadaceae bacterium]
MRRKLGKKGKPGQKDRKAQIGSYKIGKLILFSMEKHILPYLSHCEEKAQQKSAAHSNLIELPKQFNGGSSDE